MSAPAAASGRRRKPQQATGPKTIAGKRRSSLNALRHGLLAAAPPGGVSTETLEALAASIAGPCSRQGARWQLAFAVATAEYHLQLVRAQRLRGLANLLHAAAHPAGGAVWQELFGGTPAQKEEDILFTDALLPPLTTTDPWAQFGFKVKPFLSNLYRMHRLFGRYERRALMRRRRALEAFMLYAPHGGSDLAPPLRGCQGQ